MKKTAQIKMLKFYVSNYYLKRGFEVLRVKPRQDGTLSVYFAIGPYHLDRVDWSKNTFKNFLASSQNIKKFYN